MSLKWRTHETTMNQRLVDRPHGTWLIFSAWSKPVSNKPLVNVSACRGQLFCKCHMFAERVVLGLTEGRVKSATAFAQAKGRVRDCPQCLLTHNVWHTLGAILALPLQRHCEAQALEDHPRFFINLPGPNLLTSEYSGNHPRRFSGQCSSGSFRLEVPCLQGHSNRIAELWPMRTPGVGSKLQNTCLILLGDRLLQTSARSQCFNRPAPGVRDLTY